MSGWVWDLRLMLCRVKFRVEGCGLSSDVSNTTILPRPDTYLILPLQYTTTILPKPETHPIDISNPKSLSLTLTISLTFKPYPYPYILIHKWSGSYLSRKARVSDIAMSKTLLNPNPNYSPPQACHRWKCWLLLQRVAGIDSIWKPRKEVTCPKVGPPQTFHPAITIFGLELRVIGSVTHGRVSRRCHAPHLWTRRVYGRYDAPPVWCLQHEPRGKRRVKAWKLGRLVCMGSC